MSFVCRSFVLVYHSDVTRICSYAIRMSIVCTRMSFEYKTNFYLFEKVNVRLNRLHEILQLAQNIDITRNCVLVQKDEHVEVLITATKLHSSLNLESAQVQVLLSKCHGLAMVTTSGIVPTGSCRPEVSCKKGDLQNLPQESTCAGVFFNKVGS